MAYSGYKPALFQILKKGYSRADFRADLMAGLTVAVIALPLSAALAVASGASPDQGLLTSIVAGCLIALLGGSRAQIGGPTGACVVVVFNIMAQHGYEGLVLATSMAGLMLIAAGCLRFGQAVKFVPHAVITGFTSGIAVIIASSQIKDFLGLHIDSMPADVFPQWMACLRHLHTLEPVTLAVGLIALGTAVWLRRHNPKYPAYLMAIVVATLLVHGLHLPLDTIGTRFPHMDMSIPTPSVPAWSWLQLETLLPSAFTIAFLVGIEALLSATVADGMTGYRHNPNQELIGQGVSNIASAALGGLPATGVIARTATNVKSGCKTPLSGIFHALFVLLFVWLGAHAIDMVPMVALSAVLLLVAWHMSEMNHFAYLYRTSKQDRVVLLLTFALTVLVNLTVAIAVGVTLAAFIFMQQMTQHVEIASQKHTPWPEDADDQRLLLPDGVEVFRMMGPIFFGVVSELMDTFKLLDQGELPNVLIVRMSMVPYLDTTGAKSLIHLVVSCTHTHVILSGLRSQPRRMLKQAGLPHDPTRITLTSTYTQAIRVAHDKIKQFED